MNNFEQMEEKSEVVFSSGQLVFLAFGIVVLVLISFVIGYSMGKKSERKYAILGSKQNNDLLARLDKLEEESKNFKAKRALTALRKRELNLKTPETSKVLTPRVTLNDTSKRKNKYSLAVVKVKSKGFGKKYKITKKRRSVTRKIRSTKNRHKTLRRSYKTAKRRNIIKSGIAKRKNRVARKRIRRRKVYAFGKVRHSSNKKASR